MVQSFLIHHHLVFLAHKVTVTRRLEQCLRGCMEGEMYERKGWKKENNRIWVKTPSFTDSESKLFSSWYVQKENPKSE